MYPNQFLRLIEIENFKSFSSHIEIVLSPGYNLINGPNGTGKSNLLDAICCAFGCETKLLRVTSYPELLNTQGIRSASSGFVSLHIAFPTKEDIVRVDINEKGASWTLNNHQQTAKEIRAYGSKHGYNFSEGSIGIVRQNYISRILDEPRMISDAIENANGAKRLLDTIRIAHAELMKSTESQNTLKKTLTTLQEKIENDEKKQKSSKKLLELLTLEEKTKLQTQRLQLCLSYADLNHIQQLLENNGLEQENIKV